MQAEHRTCRHHWIIQPAEGAVSLGVCRLCLEEKEFQNTIDYWGFYSSTRAPSRAGLAADSDGDDG